MILRMIFTQQIHGICRKRINENGQIKNIKYFVCHTADM